MGYLVINHITFTLNEAEDNNILSLTNFLDAGNHARKNHDIINSTTELFLHKFTWGYFYDDFVYKSYSELIQKDSWKWLPQTVHQAFTTFFFQNPSGRSDFANFDEFLNFYKLENLGSIGCKCKLTNSDVYDIMTWHLWKNSFYQENPQLYIWKPKDHEFLPNKSFSDNILEREVLKHGKIDKLSENKNSVGLTFHNEVMKLKGPNLRAYTLQIATEIAEANFYKYEKELSVNEKEFTGSPRKIFSMINKKGEKIYLSIDHAHGMFEYHNFRGEHLGEYKFDGSFNSYSDSSHNLKTI
ncbi:hypothetical protein [uncultured Chryseobacterium sp.]|uniref:hypothetical protein n=1 Tax=uncultured Chryseobacterium sp. TaxID=259322 RepID=UPI0025F2C35E|nr:hypothetical protein [uncultured Chryseobacterium sp.]